VTAEGFLSSVGCLSNPSHERPTTTASTNSSSTGTTEPTSNTMSTSSLGSEVVEGTICHANRHVSKFLNIPRPTHLPQQEVNEKMAKDRPGIQILHNGQELTAARLLDNDQNLNLREPILVIDSSKSIGMKVPTGKGQKQPVTIREIADLIGHHHPVHVIDVEYQEELEGWSLGDLVDYFEDETRKLHQQPHQRQQQQQGPAPLDPDSNPRRRRRKAADKCMHMTDRQRPRVLNQISLEFSTTALSEKVLSPRFVRDMDWIDRAWPRKKKVDGTLERPIDEAYPRVQYYCLTSAGGCYTDFHVDFGGTSVWYHVLDGEKDFCLIPPTKENLAIYEDWLCRPNQADIFLPDLIPDHEKNVVRVSLKMGQTLVIPTAWIHAVYTPTDSLVFGGNFLHGADIPLQLAVHCLECRTRVQEKFRFPFFLPMNFYAGGFYLNKLRRGDISTVEVDGLEVLMDALEEWWKVHKNSHSKLSTGLTVAEAAIESARQNHCTTVEDFLEELRREHRRVKDGGISPNPIRSNLVTVPVLPTEATSSSSKPKLRLSLKKPLQSPSPPEPKIVPIDNAPDTVDSEPTAKVPLSISDDVVLQTVSPKHEVESKKDAPQKDQKINNDTKKPTSTSKFRITLSSKATTNTFPSKAKRSREDTEWIDDGAPLEDEWIPSPTSKNRRKGPVQKPPTRTAARSKPLTARERVMKRFW